MSSASKDPLVIRDKIMRAIQVGDVEEALCLGRRMIKLPMASVQDCMAVSEMGQRFADAQVSVLGARAAHKRAPNDVQLLLNMVATERDAGYTKNALKWMARAAVVCRTPEDLDKLGNHYSLLGEVDLAHATFAKASAMAPDNTHSLFNLAVSFGFLGQTEEAERLYDLAIAKGLRTEFVYQNRSWLRKQTPENNHIAELKQALDDLPDEQKKAPRLLYALGKEHEDLGRDRVASTRPRTGHSDHFIDKRPTNFLFCGAIARALPNAQIVHVRRNPMDGCYAMFKQMFHEGFEFSYDQQELATVYLAYLKLMDHWDTVMPGRIIHVQYEDIVSNPEDVTRDLIQRLGLTWEDACLDFTANPQASMTASAAQVRQPIYTSSVGKWRQFEQQLAPLREALEAGGLEIN